MNTNNLMASGRRARVPNAAWGHGLVSCRRPNADRPGDFFEVDLPGLKPEEIRVTVDSDGLSISGQRLPRQ